MELTNLRTINQQNFELTEFADIAVNRSNECFFLIFEEINQEIQDYCRRYSIVSAPREVIIAILESHYQECLPRLTIYNNINIKKYKDERDKILSDDTISDKEAELNKEEVTFVNRTNGIEVQRPNPNFSFPKESQDNTIFDGMIGKSASEITYEISRLNNWIGRDGVMNHTRLSDESEELVDITVKAGITKATTMVTKTLSDKIMSDVRGTNKQILEEINKTVSKEKISTKEVLDTSDIFYDSFDINNTDIVEDKPKGMGSN